MINLQAWDKNTVEKLFPLFKELQEKYKKALPSILYFGYPFMWERDKKRLIYYLEYLEDVVVALEIGLDKDASSKIETLAKETAYSKETPPWREALEQV